MANQEEVFKKVISHAKEYGFVVQSSEIYDGLAAVYDYGQNGVALKNNIREYWWKSMVQLHENIVGVDAAIFMHPKTWKASGHVDGFNDPMIDNKDSKKRYRADVLIEEHIEKYVQKIEKEVIKGRKRFGEDFDEVNGDGADMDDNARNPKEKEEAQQEVVKLLTTVKETSEKFKTKEIVKTLIGQTNALISSHKTNEKECFGIGKDKDEHYWMALTRQLLVAGLLKKEIEQYGILHLTPKGREFLEKPYSFMMTKDHVYDEGHDDSIVTVSKSGGGAADEKLLALLKDLRKREAQKHEVPPFVVFQDPSLDDMALKYPITQEELLNIHGVGEGKGKSMGNPS